MPSTGWKLNVISGMIFCVTVDRQPTYITSSVPVPYILASTSVCHLSLAHISMYKVSSHTVNLIVTVVSARVMFRGV